MSSTIGSGSTTAIVESGLRSQQESVSESSDVPGPVVLAEPKSTKSTNRIVLKPLPDVKPKEWTYTDEQKEKIEALGEVTFSFHFVFLGAFFFCFNVTLGC